MKTDHKSAVEPAIELLGIGLYYEEHPVGRRFRTVGRTLTEADIVQFINATGMTEVLFTNLEYLREESDIRGRIVPASMVFAFAEGLLMQATLQHTGAAFLHMDLNVESPTFAGDTIHVECEVIEARLSKSRPDRGLVRTRNQVVKQDGTVVLVYTPLRMVKCRPA
jgi:acyl dehydratase